METKFSIIVIQENEKHAAQIEYQLSNFGFDHSIHFRNVEDYLSERARITRPHLVINGRRTLNFDISIINKLLLFKEDSVLVSYCAELIKDGLWPDEKFNLKEISEDDDSYADCFKNESIYFYHSMPLETELFNVKGLKAVPVSMKESFIPSDLYRPALFLDRDGIINVDKAYLYKVSEMELYEKSVDLIKYFNDKNMPVCVVTNQSGVAREKYSLDDVDKLHDHMSDVLLKKGAKVDGWYVSPYHEVDNGNQFDKKSLLRKPFPGMLLQAGKDLPIRFDHSYMIGDKSSDYIDLENQGLRTYHVSRQYDLSEAKGLVCDDLGVVLEKIKKVLE